MGRIYTSTIDNVEWTNGQGDIDFWNYEGVSNVILKLLYIDLIQTTDFGDALAEIIRWDIVMSTDTGSDGSGGSVNTPEQDPGEASPLGNFRTMDTTRMSGTLVDRWRSGWNIQAGLLWTPPEDLEISVAGAFRLAVGSESSINSTVRISGTIGFEQIGGV